MIGDRIGRRRLILSPITLWVWPTGRPFTGRPESPGDWTTADLYQACLIFHRRLVAQRSVVRQHRDPVDMTLKSLACDKNPYFPASFAKLHQSLRTMSRPFSSCAVTILSPTLVTVSAAYFFFFSNNMDLKTPSMSISSSLYNLLTSPLT